MFQTASKEIRIVELYLFPVCHYLFNEYMINLHFVFCRCLCQIYTSSDIVVRDYGVLESNPHWPSSDCHYLHKRCRSVVRMNAQCVITHIGLDQVTSFHIHQGQNPAVIPFLSLFHMYGHSMLRWIDVIPSDFFQGEVLGAAWPRFVYFHPHSKGEVRTWLLPELRQSHIPSWGGTEGTLADPGLSTQPLACEPETRDALLRLHHHPYPLGYFRAHVWLESGLQSKDIPYFKLIFWIDSFV